MHCVQRKKLIKLDEKCNRAVEQHSFESETMRIGSIKRTVKWRHAVWLWRKDAWHKGLQSEYHVKLKIWTIVVNKKAMWLMLIVPIKNLTSICLKIISAEHVWVHHIVDFSFDIEILRGL